MEVFAYKLLLAPKYHDFAAWDASVQQTFTEHAAYLKEGVEKGHVLIVARADSQPKDNFGLVAFKAKNVQDATTFMNGDPAVKKGIMTASVYPFKLLMVTPEASRWNVW